MTPAFAKVMDGAKAGDYRVFAATADQFYAVHVLQVTPPSVAAVRGGRSESIVQKLYGEAVQKSVEDWVAKLRKVHPVQVHLAKVGS